MSTHHPIFIMSMLTIAAIPQRRFVGFDGDLCAAGEKAVGVTEFDVDADDQASLNVLGSILIEAGGAIDVGEDVESDAAGLAVALDVGVSNGCALDAAVAAGDLIRIVRGI